VEQSARRLWPAARWRLPVTFLVLRNGGYGALRGIVAQTGVSGTPGLDLPGIDAVRIAEGYELPAQHVTDLDELETVFANARPEAGPRLVEVPITNETRPFG
jgi:benzoylformate decarboxylase